MNEPSLLEWLRRTESVQVLEAEAGPYATPGLEHAHFSHHVWVSNGAQDPREWAGTLIAKCSTEQDAALIAYALSQIQDQVQKEPRLPKKTARKPVEIGVAWSKRLQISGRRRFHALVPLVGNEDTKWALLCTGRAAARQYKGWATHVDCAACKKALNGAYREEGGP